MPLPPLYKDKMMQHGYVGWVALRQIGAILDHEQPETIFLVTGKRSYATSPAHSVLEKALQPYRIVHFSVVSHTPQLEDIKHGIAALTAAQADLTVAIGGGSVIDTAKAITVFAHNPATPEEYLLKKQVLANASRVVAIPTTAGMGSEATKFAVVYMQNTKYSLDHAFVLPRYAIVDPALAMTMPPQVAATSGMDAFAQAIESYWSVHATPASQCYARAALRLIKDHLVESVTQGTPQSREAMARAAHLAGKAITISYTTACHAISYPITAHFGVPHGHAVALTLGAMLEYNAGVQAAECNDARGVPHVRRSLQDILQCLGVGTPAEGRRLVERLMLAIGLAPRLTQVGITTAQDRALIVKYGFHPERVVNNPRRLTEDALHTILAAVA
jgi:alcohol dehydrogenase